MLPGIVVVLLGLGLLRVLRSRAHVDSRAQSVELLRHPDARATLYSPLPARAVSDGRPAPTVVILHGGGNDRLYGLWYLVEQLLRHRFRVLTFHLPGHGVGGSDRFSLAACRARLAAAIDALRSRPRVGPLVLLGQSLGGALALDALANGLEVDGVIAVSAPCDGDSLLTRPLRECRALLHRSLYRALCYCSLLQALPAVGRFRRASFPVRVDGGRYLDVFRRALATMRLPERLASANPAGVPVLLLHGLSDGVVPPGHARRLHRALRGQARLRLIPALTHLEPLLDREVVAELATFIKGVRRAPCTQLPLTREVCHA